MRKLLYALMVVTALPFVAACEPNVLEETKDVEQAHDDAAKAVEAQQREVQDTAQEGADAVLKEQRELEDTARKETEKIIQEQRELEDAKRKEATPPNP
jgi:hypothetical protein